MEISNSKRGLGLMFAALLGTCLLVTACSSDEDQVFTAENKMGNIITLSNGETLHLSDTTTYELEFDEAMAIGANSYCDDCFSPQTRASSDSYRAYGYDSEEPESDWRKYSLGSSWSQYGISSGIYIARYIKVHKNLVILPNKSIVEGTYDSPNAPKDAMGWRGTTKIIGFTASPSTIHSNNVFNNEKKVKTVIVLRFDCFIPLRPLTAKISLSLNFSRIPLKMLGCFFNKSPSVL